MRFLLRLDDVLTLFINRLAIPYDDGVHVKHRLMKYHDFFVERITSGDQVLEIGCGYGALSFSIVSRANCVVTGIDRHAPHIVKAQSRYHHPNLRFIEGDALGKLPSGPWDVIVLSNVLEHINQRVEFLINIQSKINPKRWLIRVPMINRDWRVPLRKELGLFYFSDREHFTEYTQKSFHEEMKEARLRINHIQYNWGEIWAEVNSSSNLPSDT